MTDMHGGADLRYRTALAQGRLEIQKCDACHQFVFPPRELCPHCDSGPLIWAKVSGRGSIHACTVVSRKSDEGGPYNVVLVDLEEGVRLMSVVPAFEGQEVPITLPVQARIEPHTHRVVFDPA